MLGSKFPKFLSFLKQQISFSSNFASMSRVMTHNFYILSTKGVYPSTNLVKFYVSSQKSEILHFDGRLLSKSCSFNKKSTEELSLMILKCAAKFKENWLVVSNMTQEIWWIFTQTLKNLKIPLRWVLFVPSIMLQFESFRGIMCHDTESWCKS